MAVSIVMAYVLPMMLGQTYDFGKSLPGIQIFNESTYEKSERIVHYATDSQYRMVDSSTDIKDFLSVKGKLAVQVKAGLVNVEGEGSYMRDKASKSNSVEILVKVHFETETRSISSNWAPNPDWKMQDKNYLGTHYCRSITYGGDLIASIRFLATNNYDKEKIKAAVQGGVNAKGVNVDLQGQLEKIKDQLHDSSSMEMNYYATVPIPGVSYTIQGLMKLVNEFPSHVQQVNNGRGNPLRMELYPLSSLDSTFPAYMENKALADQMEDLEDQFDDLMTTKRETALWVNSLPPDISEVSSQKISRFIEKVENVYSAYTKAIAELDLSTRGSMKPFEDAFNAYGDGGTMIPGKYMRSFKQLRKEIYKESPELQPQYGGANYIHWGSPTCRGSGAETEVSGIAVASVPVTKSGSSGLLCVPSDPDLAYASKSGQEDATRPLLSPVYYRGFVKRLEDAVGKPVPCAICRVNRRTTTLVAYAAIKCPSGWTEEYSGLMMAPADTTAGKGRYVCVDENLKPGQQARFGSSSAVQELVEVKAGCGSLPCKPYVSGSPLSCTVCTR